MAEELEGFWRADWTWISRFWDLWSRVLVGNSEADLKRRRFWVESGKSWEIEVKGEAGWGVE